MKRIKAGLYELWTRITTVAMPKFWQRLRNVGLAVLAVGAGLAALPNTDVLLFILREGNEKYEQPIYISTLMLAWGIVSPIVSQFAMRADDKAKMEAEKRKIIMSN